MTNFLQTSDLNDKTPMIQLEFTHFFCTALLAANSLLARTASLAQTERVGGDVHAHGCRPSAGYAWNAQLAQCVRPWHHLHTAESFAMTSQQKNQGR